MKPRTWIITLICAIALGSCILPARAAEEDDLIAALAPDRSPADKDKACQRLKRIGTAKSVPALAALLPDEALSHSARYALESMQAPEAGIALRDALSRTTGLTRIGIIDSIGQRREATAAGALKGLLSSDDPATASAAAAALGQIGTTEACDALRSATPAPAVRPVVEDALLLCAERLMERDSAAAAALYRELHRSDVRHVRTAAFRGLVLAAGDKGTEMVVQALKGDDAADLAAALQLVAEIAQSAKHEEQAAKAFIAMLPDAKPTIQIRLIDALAQQGDSSACWAVRPLLASPSAEVRMAAIRALRVIGDDDSGVALVRHAVRTTGPEQEAARQSLGGLRNYCAVLTMLDTLYFDFDSKASVAERVEIARALGQQTDVGMAVALYSLSRDEDASVRLAALRSLANMPDARVEPLLKLLASAASDAERTAAEAALLAACTRTKASANAEQLILAALRKNQEPAVRASLFRIAGQLGGDDALAALRAALKDPDATIQETALRTLSQFGQLNAADDLLALAREDARPLQQRVLALRGYWRIVTAASIPPEQRIALCKAGLAASQRPEERRLGLAALARTPHPEALKLAEQSAADAAVRGEAQSAIVRIAAALGTSSPDIARSSLRRVLDNPASDALRTEARQALDTLDQYVGYIATWSVAGPYREAGKQCMQLFDIPFAPEKAGAEVKWRPLTRPADPAQALLVDLLPIADGEQCVVYARARVYSPAVYQVRLDIGSDDGMKLWINGELVHANNTQRPLKPLDDRAAGRLKEGWNDLLVKVTQNNMGFGFCLRIRAADGSVIEGLKSDNAMPQP